MGRDVFGGTPNTAPETGALPYGDELKGDWPRKGAKRRKIFGRGWNNDGEEGEDGGWRMEGRKGKHRTSNTEHRTSKFRKLPPLPSPPPIYTNGGEGAGRAPPFTTGGHRTDIEHRR